jgi:hypothetical protein
MSKPVLLEKSPPAIVRAFDIEQAFVPSYFIAIIRDPYAFCEGRRRRYGGDMKTCAQIWVRHASFQMRNVQGLKNITYFRYEDFADNPAAIKDQILNFMPDLKDIDAKQSFNARSVRGRADRTIRNFNSEKIDRLSGRDIREANIVLRQNGQVMDYFRYEYLKPSVAHAIRYFKAVGAAKALNRISNKAMRTWTHRANHKH